MEHMLFTIESVSISEKIPVMRLEELYIELVDDVVEDNVKHLHVNAILKSFNNKSI